MSEEVEFKFELTPEQYDRIVAELNGTLTDERTYWNIYYDTPGLDIYQSGCCLRISVKEDEQGELYDPKITFKGKNRKDTVRGLNIREEIEESLPEPISKDIVFQHYAVLFSEEQGGTPWKRVAPLIKGHPLVWAIGGVKINRKKYLYNGAILEVDKVSFNVDARDYELEVETDEPERVYPLVLSLLDRLHIDLAPSKQGKHGRFLQHRERHGREKVFGW